MPDPHAALADAQAALMQASAALLHAQAAVEAAMGMQGPAVPLKRAAHEMGVPVATARKRAQRGAGFKLGSDWYFPKAYLDTLKREAVSTSVHLRGPDTD